MNKRIRELEAQCWEPTKYGPPWFDSQKFAELIVRECVNAVMDGSKEGDHYAMRIEQHFDKSQGGTLHFGVKR